VQGMRRRGWNEKNVAQSLKTNNWGT